MTTDDPLRAEFEEWAEDKVTDDGDEFNFCNGKYSWGVMQDLWESYRAAHASGVRAGLERARELSPSIEENEYTSFEAGFNSAIIKWDNAIQREIER